MKQLLSFVILAIVATTGVSAQGGAGSVPFDSLFKLPDASAPPPQGPVQVTFDVPTERVSASGLVAGARTFFFGYIKELIEGTWLETHRLHETATADASGFAAIDLDRSYDGATVWLAIDLERGDSGVEVSGGRELRLPDIDGITFRRPSEANAPVQIRYEGKRLEVVWIRPGVGSWAREFRDGGEDDMDLEENAQLTVPLTSLKPRGETRPNERLREILEGDRVLFFDTKTFRGVLVEAVEDLQ